MALKREDDDIAVRMVEKQKRESAEEAVRKRREARQQEMEEAKERIMAHREQAQAKQTKPQTYAVQAGDTLGKIAQKLLGDGARWTEIYEANKDQIANPDVIEIGQELRIPPK
jgi:nucleoid-associated protein YgaU